MGARNRKEMADLVSTELAQLNKLSRDLESYWQTKTAESSSIRDWRLRYRTWLRHTESAVGKTKSEDEWQAAERARLTFNAHMRNDSRKLEGLRESPELEARMIAYDPSYADDIAHAKAVYDREVDRVNDAFFQDLFAHRAKVKAEAQDLADDINQLARRHVVAVSVGEKPEDTEMEVQMLDKNISAYAAALREKYAQYEQYSQLESPICTPEHIQAAQSFMARSEAWAAEAAEAEIGEGVKDFIRLTFTPLIKDLEDYEPELEKPKIAIIRAHKAPTPTQGPDSRLLDEMAEYAQGPYDAARGHLDDINALVARVGYGCPPIEVPAENAQESARTAVLADIKELKSTMDSFGFQDHGRKRTTLIEPLRESLDGLLGSSSKRTQKRHIELYRAYASALEVWVRTAWTQFGGTPKGAKEAKYRRMASGK